MRIMKPRDLGKSTDLPHAYVLELACDGLDGQCSRTETIVAPNQERAHQERYSLGWRRRTTIERQSVITRNYCPQCVLAECWS